jgi:glycosyltransferase involved in cell wall biosynthesis
MNKEVIHVVTTIDRGGAENALLLLAKLQTHRHRTIIVPLKGALEMLADFKECNVTVDLSLVNKSFFWQVIKFKSMYKSADVLHGHLPRAELLLFFSKWTKKYFVTRHNAEPFAPFLNHNLSSILSCLVLFFSKQVICISESVAIFIISNKEILQPSKISVVYYGYEQRFTNLERSKMRNERHECITNLVSVCRLAKQKNVQMMLDFMQQVKQYIPEAQLDIFGDGPEREGLSNYCKHQGITNVNFRGKSNRILDEMKHYDLFLITSNYEGFGLVLLEAMDCGLPILAPNNTAFPEVLGSEYPGLFASNEMNSLIEKFLFINNSIHNRETVLEALDKRIATFSPEALISGYETAYDLK